MVLSTKLSMAVVAAAMLGAAVATPHPECEVCASVSAPDLESLTVAGKYLCCDLTCIDAPVDGCGMFGLAPQCKACYDGDSTPAYDDPPVGGTPSTTPSPVTVAAPVGGTPATTTPSPVAAAAPISGTPATPSPVTDETTEPLSYGFADDDDSEVCTACDSALVDLTEEDWENLALMGYELVCDPACYANGALEGCGAYGLDIGCRSAPIVDEEGTSSSGGGGGGGGGGYHSSDTTGSEGGQSTVSTSMTGTGAGGGGGQTTSMTGTGSGGGGGQTTSMTGTGSGGGGGQTTSMTGTGAGGGGGQTTSMTGTGSGGGGGQSISSDCTADEIAKCGDISQEQEEALAQYDNGGKIIVCDPTCSEDGVDPIHCNYFGLGQNCRGCGSCSDCTPCP
ncbi:unnamed protein product [Pylaiella littoralis]